ncbi:heavy metal sensor histidine kinase [Variovorax sp.]|uniref:heavy metal sensor histidine kinase n=1 Tax=Variovorax sp. TaxID=1871043 RepID=UPI000C3DE598|nr:heavy metal sensor histidine kinase [Variovorax sp.]MBS77511.1 two-component sensor histidine kinase [Variovorax sp.]
MKAPRVRFGSISARLVLMLAVVAVAVFAATGYLLHKALEQVLIADERSDLSGKTEVVQHFIDEVRTPADLPMLRRHLAATSVGGRYRWNVWLIARDGEMLYGAEPMPPTLRGEGNKVWLQRQDGVVLRGAHYRLDEHAIFPGAQVLIGMDPRPRAEMLDRYDNYGLLVGALGVLCTVALGAIATRRGLRALADLSREASVIRPGGLSQRLTLPADSTELLPLALRFNEVLARMEDAWTQLEGFNADVAHELRTPLAIMINGAELALARDRPRDEMREVLESHLEELRTLGSMVNDMLFLARADRGDAAEDLRELSLGEQARQVGEFVEVFLEEKRQRLEIEGDASVPVNRVLLRRALVNLLTNASRHAPVETVIGLRIEALPEGARITVANPGDAIPEEVRQHMFERFWRGDSSRPRTGERFGLGLAIVRAIARMHGGETFVQGTPGVNEIGFTLQRQTAASPEQGARARPQAR